MNKEEILAGLGVTLTVVSIVFTLCFCVSRMSSCAEKVSDDSYYTKGFNAAEQIYIQKMKDDGGAE